MAFDMKHRMRPAVDLRATARANGSGKTAGRIKLDTTAAKPAGPEGAIPENKTSQCKMWSGTSMELKEGLQSIIADLHIALIGMDSLQTQCDDPLLREWLSRKCEQVSEMCQVLDTMKANQPDFGFDSGHHPDNGILSSKR